MTHIHTTNPQTPRMARLNQFIAFAVLFLAAANGIFTFSGAQLYVNEILYALLFAVAVQMSIGITLLALPYVQGLGKLALILVYIAALSLSTLSAYTYIYNAAQPDSQQDIRALDTATKAHMADTLGAALQQERELLNQQSLALARLKRAADEEAGRGGRSGYGPGMGPEYYRKIEAYDEANEQHNLAKGKLERVEPLYTQLTERLSDPITIEQRPELASRLSAIRALTTSPETEELLSRIVNEDLGNIRNPVERAILPLLQQEKLSLDMLVSVVWAAIFDLLALFLGIIRYYLLKPDYSLLNTIYEGVVGLATFFFRLGYIKREARAHYHREFGGKLRDQPLGVGDMQSFATALIAGSELAGAESKDPGEPFRTIVGYLEPLHLESAANSVGIPHKTLEKEVRLKPLMALLLQHDVFLNISEEKCYLLNSSAEMAQKVLLFMRMGLKGQAGLSLKDVSFRGLPASS